MTPPGQRELTCALDRLAALLGAGDGDPAGVDEMAELSRRLREDVLRVPAAGGVLGQRRQARPAEPVRSDRKRPVAPVPERAYGPIGALGFTGQLATITVQAA